ncbi:MAG TPA: Crp/Fnr family transcriptional regulator [Xanthobacteraceae bacterium]|nr:Crp/Fnr family transcriptional regulator [Xanthobacteraceae bacterium]
MKVEMGICYLWLPRFTSPAIMTGSGSYTVSQPIYNAGASATITCMLGPNDTALRPREAEKRGVLQSHCLFGKLNPKHIDRLVACTVEKSVARGAIIFAKDDPGSSLFAIRKGTVKITIPSVDGHDAVFNRMTDGDIFGEVALLDGRPRSADAVAITDCELFVIERRDFLPLVQEEPQIAIKLIEILCARLRQTTAQAESLMFLHLPGRLAKALLRLSSGDTVTNERKIAITQKDLGNFIGMARETTNRQLRLWAQQNWLRLERGGIVILSVKELERIAESDSEDS